MGTRTPTETIRLALCCSWVALTLAACEPVGQTDEASKPAPTESTPDPVDPSPPEDSPAEPTQPAPDAPPPTEPSPTAKPTSAAGQPPLESMSSAIATAKMGAPVDLKYSFDSPPGANQPVTLHLAAVPRVSGSNLEVNIRRAEGLSVSSSGELAARKADASGTYRQQYSITLQDSVPSELRVLVTMDTPEGSTFGFFGIPLEPGIFPQKQNSVKQR